MTKPRPPIEEVRRVLDYDPVTGIFRWRVREDASAYWNRRFAGKQAGYVNKPGANEQGSDYRRIEWKGWGPFPASHLAWAITYGVWPKGLLDHRNLSRDASRRNPP